jgi:hypothetical protein
LYRLPDRNSYDTNFCRFSHQTGLPVNFILNRKNRLSENRTIDYSENLRLWSVIHQQFFCYIYYDIWHLHWCQKTLFAFWLLLNISRWKYRRLCQCGKGYACNFASLSKIAGMGIIFDVLIWFIFEDKFFSYMYMYIANLFKRLT